MEEAAIEPTARRKQNPKQVALLPANALISRRIVLPPRPVSSRSNPRWRGTLGAHAIPSRLTDWPRTRLVVSTSFVVTSPSFSCHFGQVVEMIRPRLRTQDRPQSAGRWLAGVNRQLRGERPLV